MSRIVQWKSLIIIIKKTPIPKVIHRNQWTLISKFRKYLSLSCQNFRHVSNTRRKFGAVSFLSGKVLLNLSITGVCEPRAGRPGAKTDRKESFEKISKVFELFATPLGFIPNPGTLYFDTNSCVLLDFPIGIIFIYIMRVRNKKQIVLFV